MGQEKRGRCRGRACPALYKTYLVQKIKICKGGVNPVRIIIKLSGAGTEVVFNFPKGLM